ncbi:MAG: ABC transporter permease [Alphaproteobacteria bacterium]|nr:ABC transporter permease [Alphaproteobacteria bacterium]
MYRYFLLTLYKTYADLRAESQRTHAGFIWWIVEPLLHMAVYYLVFAVLMRRGGEDFVPFLLVGLVTWRWFHVSLMQGSNAISGNKRLMQQLYIFKLLFPTVTILSNAIKFLFTLAILLVFLWIYGLLPSIHYTALPVLLVVQLLFISGCTYIAAAILPFMPDLRIMLDNALRAMMFLSGIFFAGSIVPEHLQFWFYLNPMAVLLESYRNILMYEQWPMWEHLAAISVVSMAMIAVGIRLTRRYDYSYPKLMM